MGQFAARLGDLVAHPLPPILTGGPCSPNVWIGSQPAWLGIPRAALAALMETVSDAEKKIHDAELKTEAAMGTPTQGAAETDEEKTRLDQTKRVAEAIAALAASGISIHGCTSLLPTPAPGIVTTGSMTVQINGLSACRSGDTIFEGIHSPNAITGGCPTVWIGG